MFAQVLETAHQDAPRPRPARSSASQDTQGRAVAKRPGPDTGADRAAQAERSAQADHAEQADRNGPAERPASSAKPATGRVHFGQDDGGEGGAAVPADARVDDADKSKDTGNADAAVPQPVDPGMIRMLPQARPASAAEVSGLLPRTGDVLGTPPAQPTVTTGYAASAQALNLESQVGASAYRSEPHGVGEPVLPQHQTGPINGFPAALTHADPEQQGVQADAHVVSAAEMVQLSNAARASQIAAEDTSRLGQEARGDRPAAHADPHSAQSRNEILQQIGGAAATVAVQNVTPPAGKGEQGAAPAPSRLAVEAKDLKAAPADAAPAPDAGTPPALQHLGTAGATQQAADAPGTGKADAFDPAMLNRIVDQSRWLIRNGRSEVTLKLQPEHLGELRLKVMHKDGELTVQMTVDSSAAKHILEASLNDLRARLQAEQLAQGNLTLNVDVRQGSDPGNFARMAQQAPEVGKAQGLNGGPAESAPAQVTPKQVAWGASNISIYA